MKNQKTSTKKYVTLKDGGMDFRTMAKIMTKHGFKMNHATARNQLILAVKYLLNYVSTNLKTNIPPAQLEKMIEDQKVHENLSDIIYLAFNEEEESNE
jgi:hypothetical protein